MNQKFRDVIVLLGLSLVFCVFVLGRSCIGPCLWTCSHLFLFLYFSLFVLWGFCLFLVVFLFVCLFCFFFLNVIYFLKSKRSSGQVAPLISWIQCAVQSTPSLLLGVIHILITTEVQKYNCFNVFYMVFSLLIVAEECIEINLSRLDPVLKVEGRHLSPNRSRAGPFLVINNNESLLFCSINLPL